eukprot:12426552-Alexandrium_andersonii.AAC.1
MCIRDSSQSDAIHGSPSRHHTLSVSCAPRKTLPGHRHSPSPARLVLRVAKTSHAAPPNLADDT